MYKRVIYGKVANDNVASLEDINGREIFMLTTLAIAVIVLGVWPAPLVEIMEPSIENLLHHVSQTKLN